VVTLNQHNDTKLKSFEVDLTNKFDIKLNTTRVISLINYIINCVGEFVGVIMHMNNKEYKLTANKELCVFKNGLNININNVRIL